MTASKCAIPLPRTRADSWRVQCATDRVVSRSIPSGSLSVERRPAALLVLLATGTRTGLVAADLRRLLHRGNAAAPWCLLWLLEDCPPLHGADRVCDRKLVGTTRQSFDDARWTETLGACRSVGGTWVGMAPGASGTIRARCPISDALGDSSKRPVTVRLSGLGRVLRAMAVTPPDQRSFREITSRSSWPGRVFPARRLMPLDQQPLLPFSL